ncbi:hypothetical protein EDD59_106151 [Muricomes intestini]|jgi:hypothetical protein|uniref:HEPN domain-containing protein n=1 Tax=Muricomes intestini TaxID=1796634 RepID=A0A4R3KBC9_9FIRM|nr:hypothetical protein [Muricomes intestini]TCS80325.1 hypothetical protein EDD59_106151 [Muricomes intestini]
MKKIFSYNADINKNAYMNWRTNNHEPIHNMNVIAEGYFESAILLAECCLKDNSDKKADGIIFPMLFSINHGIELYEKSICWSLNILLGNNSSFKENHDIRGIWLTTKQKIKKFGFGIGHEESEFNNMIMNLESYLDELSKTIMGDDINKAYYNIDFSRYPMNNHKEYHFYLKTYENVVVDLENFVLVFKDIKDCLSCLSGYYYGLVFESWQTND